MTGLWSEGASVRDGYTYYPTARGFLKLHRDPKPWDSARIQCHSEGIPLNKMFVDWAPSIDEDQLEKLNRCLVSYANGTMGDKGCDETLPYLCYAEVPVCGVDLEYQLDVRTDRCYKFHSQAKLWEEAYRICQQEGGYLAIINSDLEATVLKELFAKYPPEKISNGTYNRVATIVEDPAPAKVKQRARKKWTEEMNTFILRTYLILTKLELDTRSFLTELHKQFTDKFPEMDVSKQRWGDKQPETNETCGAMFRNGKLDDLPNGHKEAFICEKAPLRPCTACDHNDDQIY
ncbi:C-type lectin 21 [Operophtera brumata]|uniref:C-type lectin 21 n=1 Tax=Operophtera brumata TaxID=104452 RepID=A0A0L7LLH4_OPEBR|nr:C-type lectin 21 [Operophtera brumata]